MKRYVRFIVLLFIFMFMISGVYAGYDDGTKGENKEAKVVLERTLVGMNQVIMVLEYQYIYLIKINRQIDQLKK